MIVQESYAKKSFFHVHFEQVVDNLLPYLQGKKIKFGLAGDIHIESYSMYKSTDSEWKNENKIDPKLKASM